MGRSGRCSSSLTYGKTGMRGASEPVAHGGFDIHRILCFHAELGRGLGRTLHPFTIGERRNADET